jgi:DHA3 family macrolide efflux protein-like MFS transporter
MVGFAAMVLGGILLGVWGGFKNRYRTVLLGLVCYGIFSSLIGIVYTCWMFAAIMFLYSFFIPVVQSSVTTILQESVPVEKLGRVFGLLGAMYSGFMPLGMAVFGPLADVVKIQYMVIGCGIIIALLGVSLGRTQKTSR